MNLTAESLARMLNTEDRITTLYLEGADKHPVTGKHLDVLLEKLELFTSTSADDEEAKSQASR
jgi:hypothetical protein